MNLWREICANKLLAKTSIILFLNKVRNTKTITYTQNTEPLSLQMDILRDTLESGVQVVKYVPSYGNLPNDFYSVTKCEQCSIKY
jgi:guanine nucleotide-binding protein subunit alpha